MPTESRSSAARSQLGSAPGGSYARQERAEGNFHRFVLPLTDRRIVKRDPKRPQVRLPSSGDMALSSGYPPFPTKASLAQRQPAE